MDNCLADAPLQHRAMLRVALEDRWGKGEREREAVGDGNGEVDGGWGEHWGKVEGVGVDVEEEAGNESFCLFVKDYLFLIIRGNCCERICTYSSATIYFLVCPCVAHFLSHQQCSVVCPPCCELISNSP